MRNYINISFDDWEILFKNGENVDEGHSVISENYLETVLDADEFTYISIELEDIFTPEEYENMQDSHLSYSSLSEVLEEIKTINNDAYNKVRERIGNNV